MWIVEMNAIVFAKICMCFIVDDREKKRTFFNFAAEAGNAITFDFVIRWNIRRINNRIESNRIELN